MAHKKIVMNHVEQLAAEKIAEQIYIRIVSEGLSVIGQSVDLSEATKAARAAGQAYITGGSGKVNSPVSLPIKR